MTDSVPAAELKPAIMKILGLPADRVLVHVGDDYPECLCMVVVGDTGPAKMREVCDLLRERGNSQWRLCANVVEKKYAHRFEGLSPEAAFEESWQCNIATVRMG